VDVLPPTTIIKGRLKDGSDYIFNTWTNSNYVDVFLECKDQINGSKCKKTQYCIEYLNTCIFDLYMNYIQIEEEGIFNINYMSTDAENNTEETKTKTVKIDTTPPQITISSPQNKTYFSREIELKVYSNEPIDKWLYSVNSHSNISFNPNITIVSENNSNRLIVIATDRAGNYNYSVVYYYINISNTTKQETIALDNLTINEFLTNEPIVVGKQVVWRKQIKIAGDVSNKTIDTSIPKEAIDISIFQNPLIEKTQINENAINEKKEITISFKHETKKKTKDLISLSKKSIEKSEIEITYKTKAPYIIDKGTFHSGNRIVKSITVGSNVSMHYENVLACEDIKEMEDSLNKKLIYVDENNHKIDVTGNSNYNVAFYDTDGNSKTDKICFIVPYLSDRNFEIMGDFVFFYSGASSNNWTVYFSIAGNETLYVYNQTDNIAFNSLYFYRESTSSYEIYTPEENSTAIWFNWYASGYSKGKIIYDINEYETYKLKFVFGDVIDYVHGFNYYEQTEPKKLDINNPVFGF
ncbi:MAG: hypothetical protein KAQ92_01230, partial [Candidatus Aenigmarchaeota archaeon]|nr:hypothetical protein [Candidatus Aenigmarchaeota archaeon]